MKFIDALLERVQRNPAGTALTAALELAEKNTDIVGAVCAALLPLPPSSIPPTAGTAAVRRLPLDDDAVAQLLQRWEDGDNTQLRTLVKGAREAAARKRN